MASIAPGKQSPTIEKPMLSPTPPMKLQAQPTARTRTAQFSSRTTHGKHSPADNQLARSLASLWPPQPKPRTGILPVASPWLHQSSKWPKYGHSGPENGQIGPPRPMATPPSHGQSSAVNGQPSTWSSHRKRWPPQQISSQAKPRAKS
jgi:hypothetical protein